MRRATLRERFWRFLSRCVDADRARKILELERSD